MDETDYTTEHRKGQHLTSEERHIIEVRFNKDKWSIYGIAKELGRPYNTVKNEIKWGTVLLYNGKAGRYKAEAGYSVYLEHRQECRRKYRRLDTSAFLQYVSKHFREDNGLWTFAPVGLLPTEPFQERKPSARKRSTAMWSLACCRSKASTCRKSSAEIPRDAKSGKTGKALGKASKNVQNQLIYGKNSDIGKLTAYLAKRMKTNQRLLP